MLSMLIIDRIVCIHSFYNDRSFEPEMKMRNSFDIRAYANFFQTASMAEKDGFKKTNSLHQTLRGTIVQWSRSCLHV